MQPINYSPMQSFNNVFASQMNQVSNNNAMTLNGGISMDVMPENIKNDPELKSDLKVLGQEGAGKVANDFQSTLSNSLKELNATQRSAEVAMETFATGGDIDVHTVALAGEKANLSMQLAMQLRNKAVQAYNEVYKMNI